MALRAVRHGPRRERPCSSAGSRGVLGRATHYTARRSRRRSRGGRHGPETERRHQPGKHAANGYTERMLLRYQPAGSVADARRQPPGRDAPEQAADSLPSGRASSGNVTGELLDHAATPPATTRSGFASPAAEGALRDAAVGGLQAGLAWSEVLAGARSTIARATSPRGPRVSRREPARRRPPDFRGAGHPAGA